MRNRKPEVRLRRETVTLIQQSCAKCRIAGQKVLHLNPRNFPVVPPIGAVTLHTPPRIKQPNPKCITQACRNGQPFANINQDDSSADSWLDAARWQDTPAPPARQSSNPINEKLPYVYELNMAPPFMLHNPKLAGSPWCEGAQTAQDSTGDRPARSITADMAASLAGIR